MEILIQNLLRRKLATKETLDAILQDLNIQHSEYSGYYLFKYSDITSAWTDITKQTRGIILDSLDNWNLVNFPFTKFFNMGDGDAAEIDWSSGPRAVNKLDGSIIYVWWSERLNSWVFSTSGTCNAFNAKVSPTLSFGAIASKAASTLMEHSELSFFDNLYKKYCYIFELQSEFNQIVVRQTGNRGTLTLIGARDLETLKEVDIHSRERMLLFVDPKWIPIPHTYNLYRRDLIPFVNSRNPSEFEGVIVVDNKFNRVKVKSKEYILARRLKSSVSSSWKNVVEIVKSGKADDVKSILPDADVERIKLVEERLDSYVKEFKSDFLPNIPEKHLQDRKYFGLYIKDNPQYKKYSTLVWEYHFAKKELSQVISNINTDFLVDLLVPENSNPLEEAAG